MFSDKNGTGETDFASATSYYRKIVGSKDVYVNYSKRCTGEIYTLWMLEKVLVVMRYME